MTRPEDAASLAEYVDATAKLLELPIRPEHRDGVLQNFERLATLARLVIAHPLGYHDEPLPHILLGKLEPNDPHGGGSLPRVDPAPVT